MKFRFFLLSLTILAAGHALPANAQEGPGSGPGMIQDGGNRWIYRPNVWGAAKAKKPQPKAYVPHSVTAGSMPKSSAFLDGLDPSQLKPTPPPPPPQVQQQVRATVSAPQVQAAPFKSDFGAPISEHIAQSKPMTESSMPAAKSMPLQRVASNGVVTGHMRRPVHSNAQIAQAASLPQIQSYGQGYTPGAFGAGTGAGQSTKTAVSGVIVRKGH